MSDGTGLLVEVAKSLGSSLNEGSSPNEVSVVEVEPESSVALNTVGTKLSFTGSLTELNCCRALIIKAIPPTPRSTIDPIMSILPDRLELTCLIVKFSV